MHLQKCEHRDFRPAHTHSSYSSSIASLAEPAFFGLYSHEFLTLQPVPPAIATKPAELVREPPCRTKPWSGSTPTRWKRTVNASHWRPGCKPMPKSGGARALSRPRRARFTSPATSTGRRCRPATTGLGSAVRCRCRPGRSVRRGRGLRWARSRRA